MHPFSRAVLGNYPRAIQIGGRWRIKKNALDKDILKEEKSGQPTVLVVDDDESLQNLFKLFLKKIGFSRVVVGTVKEAIAALEKQKFDLVFLDLKLPDGPADDVYDFVKRDQPDCPVIIITGYPDSEMLDRDARSRHQPSQPGFESRHRPGASARSFRK